MNYSIASNPERTHVRLGFTFFIHEGRMSKAHHQERDLASPIFLLGPAYSGKSSLASSFLAAEQKTLVIGTAQLQDVTLLQRIERLKQDRPKHWEHVDSSLDLAKAIKDHAFHCEQLLIDSINQWMANVLLSGLAKYDSDQLAAHAEFEVQRVCDAIAALRSQRVVLVSSETGSGTPPTEQTARLFRQLLGTTHVTLARFAKTVVHVVAGIPCVIKQG